MQRCCRNNALLVPVPAKVNRPQTLLHRPMPEQSKGLRGLGSSRLRRLLQPRKSQEKRDQNSGNSRLSQVWIILTPFDSFWLLLIHFDSFRLILDIFYLFWLILGAILKYLYFLIFSLIPKDWMVCIMLCLPASVSDTHSRHRSVCPSFPKSAFSKIFAASLKQQ